MCARVCFTRASMRVCAWIGSTVMEVYCHTDLFGLALQVRVALISNIIKHPSSTKLTEATETYPISLIFRVRSRNLPNTWVRIHKALVRTTERCGNKRMHPGAQHFLSMPAESKALDPQGLLLHQTDQAIH